MIYSISVIHNGHTLILDIWENSASLNFIPYHTIAPRRLYFNARPEDLLVRLNKDRLLIMNDMMTDRVIHQDNASELIQHLIEAITKAKKL